MRCHTEDGETWTTVRVAELRGRLAIPPCHLDAEVPKTLSVDAAIRGGDRLSSTIRIFSAIDQRRRRPPSKEPQPGP
jgi:hypothetical protein